ncbi:hypothetical protein NEUTE1DRAFT_122067 [Neurospora tetrasperma FGSC 2508]|uniref:Peroxin 11C n=1 Tax=Neurospora tetrasperma (strain FGSC 2508 / ATCC MYA-4615 / P0657) TaxID=510951 RepID=F8MM13_NEUT8|nr:uncharacterized protein NEUTE1DRAFT_122067 [Neurospora tetrasperma FGSC 2508]EGO57687.1 hypothetical protein NEUTE1DRAFT_122067 [Neurospora tetrasperma FGSC 2508]EGZ72044.1 hypothetical protein NEUTE2DRAFT_89876 [Neurospora tetrasperma FGSC 2509]
MSDSAPAIASEPVAPVADLPSGEPIPPPSAAAALEPITSVNEKKPQPSPAALAKALYASDAFLARLNKCLSTPTGIDTVLLLLCYTSKFSASILGVLSRSILQRSLREWLAVIAGSVPPGAKTAVVVDSKTAAAVAPAAAKALVHAKRLNALSTLLSEARTMTRLWALVGMYFWGKGVFAKAAAVWRAKRNPSSSSSSALSASEKEQLPSTTETAISLLQFSLCVALQVLENGAYLSSKGVLGWQPARIGKAYLWSARFWAAYVGIEIGRLLALEPKERWKEDSWKGNLAKNLAWAPLTVHWSSEKGLVSEMVVGLLGSIPGLVQMRELWASTA